MKPLVFLSAVVAILPFAACAETPVEPSARAAVITDMKRVADWQLAHPSKHAATDWTQAPFWSGLLALNRASGDAKYLDAVIAMGESNAWKLGKRPYHADDHAVGKAYAEIYALKKDPKMIADMIRVFDAVIEKPAADPADLEFKSKGALNKWSWCDSLYMAPPAWVALGAATGEAKYATFANAAYRRTQDYLYDKKQHLFYRDSTYFAKREANGASVFWGRGNGWVIAGLADLLKVLPKNDPARPGYEALMREMSEKLLSCQQVDGSWHASLLDPESYPKPEMSATALIAYGLAWGANNGVLDRDKYAPGLAKAWACLDAHILPDGMLGAVQPIGAEPKKIKPTDTEVYGSGALLQFGEEYAGLISGKR